MRKNVCCAPSKKVRSEEGATYVCKCAQGMHMEPEGREKEADCKSAELVWLGSGDEKDECTLTICEGKFHEVKRIFSAIGALRLDESFAKGDWHELSEDEIELLYRI